MKRTIIIAAMLAIAAVVQTSATETVRELWDNIPAGQLKGTANGTTSLGFYSAAQKWVVNSADPAATNVFLIDASDDALDWQVGVYPMLPASMNAPGTLSMVQPNTNGWDSGSWATRLMAQSAWINFTTNSTYYFSARLLKRGTWYVVSGTNGYGQDDAALGLGFASGTTPSSVFVGAGFTRTVAANGGGGYLASDGLTDIGDSVYITEGTLGQAGFPGHPSDSGGPYYVQAYGTAQEVEGYIFGSPYVNGGWLVGQLKTTTSGASELDVKCYISGATVATDPSGVIWDATYTFTNTTTMNYLLLWMYGNNNANPCRLDGIRVGTTWAEVIGEEIVGPPTASPTNVVYAGTPVTFSVFANVDAADAWYQWLTNGVPDTNGMGMGTNFATYTLTNPITANSGMTISVVFSNYFGLALTSSVQTLTVLPSVPPIVVTPPAGLTRFAGGSAALSVVVNGAPPFSYQWEQVVGNTTNIVSGPTTPALAFTDTLTLTNLQTTNAGSYIVTITNSIGSTNSQAAVLNVIFPSAFGAAVIANNPYAYWLMDETNGTVLHDDWNGYDGTILDPTNVFLGAAGAACVGFPSNHNAVFIPNNSYQARVDMPALPFFTNMMTICCWVYCPSVPTLNGLIMSRDTNAYEGNMSGLAFVNLITNVVNNVTNVNGQLGYQWGTALSYTWNSGLNVPLADWTFVALVLSNSQATLYMGTNNAPLTVASATLPSAVDASFPGTSYTNSFPLLMGRTGWPWAESSTNNAWANASVSMSDVAIFYNALPPTNIYELYLAAVGELITYTNSAGNLVLSWPEGTLLSSTNVQGPYNPVGGATSPYTNSLTGPRMFYRVQE